MAVLLLGALGHDDAAGSPLLEARDARRRVEVAVGAVDRAMAHVDLGAALRSCGLHEESVQAFEEALVLAAGTVPADPGSGGRSVRRALAAVVSGVMPDPGWWDLAGHRVEFGRDGTALQPRLRMTFEGEAEAMSPLAACVAPLRLGGHLVTVDRDDAPLHDLMESIVPGTLPLVVGQPHRRCGFHVDGLPWNFALAKLVRQEELHLQWDGSRLVVSALPFGSPADAHDAAIFEVVRALALQVVHGRDLPVQLERVPARDWQPLAGAGLSDQTNGLHVRHDGALVEISRNQPSGPVREATRMPLQSWLEAAAPRDPLGCLGRAESGH